MKKLEIVREVVAGAASIGAAAIVGTIATTFMPGTTTISKVINTMGKYGLESAVGGVIYKKTRADFDELVNTIIQVAKS